MDKYVLLNHFDMDVFFLGKKLIVHTIFCLLGKQVQLWEVKSIKNVFFSDEWQDQKRQDMVGQKLIEIGDCWDRNVKKDKYQPTKGG